MKKFVLLIFLPFCLFVILTMYITYPLVLHLGSWASGLGDELLLAWIQNWVIHAFTTNPLSLFDANLYYPYHTTLAYSDLFFTSSMLSFIPLKLVGQPIAAFNFTFVSSLMLLGFSVYLLSYYITKNVFSSLLAGLLVVFSPAVLDKKVHLQILAIEWVPFSILSFLHFVKTHRTRFLAISLFFFLLQTYNSFFPGYFIVFFLCVYCLFAPFYKQKAVKKIMVKKHLLLCLVALIFLLPVVIPYYKVSWEFGSVRDIRDTIHFALQPEDLLYPNEHTKLQNLLLNVSSLEKIPKNAELKEGYLGLTFTILSLLSLWWFIKNFRKSVLLNKVFTITALLGMLLSFGPFLHFGRITIHKPFPIPLPYLLFYYLLPGFKGFRNSARFEMLFIICIAVSIAIVLPYILKKLSKQTKIAVYIMLFISAVAEYNFPMHFFDVLQKKQFPKVYSFLATTPHDTSVIFMPIYNWNSPFSTVELQRDYYSTAGFRKSVNGYSGFSPPPWENLVNFLSKEFPDQKTIEKLAELKVNYIIVEEKKYLTFFSVYKTAQSPSERFYGLIATLQKNPHVQFLGLFEDAYVFTLR